MALTLLEIFVYSAFCGIGFALLLTPRYIRTRSIMLLLAPCLGLLQLSIVDGYLIAASKPINGSVPISAAVGAVALAVWFTLEFIAGRRPGGRSPSSQLPSAGSGLAASFKSAVPALIRRALMAAVVLFVVIAPIFKAHAPTMPYRIGIDQVGYAETAQYLLEGGTLDSAKQQIFAQLGTTNLVKAKAHNIYALNFGAYVNTEFLLKALRWGFPGVIASLTLFTGAGHVYRIEFICLIFCFALMIGLTYKLCRQSFGLPEWLSTICALAIAFNVNMLNVYYEGQLAEIFAEPFLLLLLIMFLALRKLDVEKTWSSAAIEPLRSGALFALILAGLFFAYNEVLVLVYGYFAATCILDGLLTRTLKWRSLAVVAIGSVVGACLAAPISVQWIAYTFANLSGLSHAGFWQPHWASLAEIIGVFNMYGGAPYVLLPRSAMNEAANLLVSLIFAALAIRMFVTNRTMDRTFWITAFVLVLAVYGKSRFGGSTLNYAYTKLATLLLPLLSLVVFASAHSWLKKALQPRFLSAAYVIPLVACALGVSYISTYVAQGRYVTQAMFDLYQFNGHRRFDDISMEMAGRQPIIRDFMLTPLVSLNWVNEVDMPKYVKPYLARPFGVALWKSDLRDAARSISRAPYRVLYENGDLVVFLFKKSLAKICIPQADQYKVDDLSNDPQDSWKALPTQQCNYGAADRLQDELNARSNV